MLRPVVQLCIRGGVTFPILADTLRTLFVDVASHEGPADGAPTDSRVALLTGIHRKELRRQRRERDEAREPETVTLHSQLLGRWLGDPSYAGQDLPRSGPLPSFDALVESVTRDVRPRTVLDEWLTQGLVTLEGAGVVRLRAQAFVPRHDEASRYYYLSRNLHDHAAAATANVREGGDVPPFLERAVHYDRLSAAAAATLEWSAREAAAATLLELNRRALAIADDDDLRAATAPSDAMARRWRVNFGLYVYAEEADDVA